MHKNINLDADELNPNKPIKNHNIKGVNTDGLVSVRLGDWQNTTIFCKPSEVEAVRKKYTARGEQFNTVSVRNLGKESRAKRKKEKEDDAHDTEAEAEVVSKLKEKEMEDGLFHDNEDAF